MARLKKTGQILPDSHAPLPEHIRVPEWNGLTAGDEVLVTNPDPGKRPRRGVHWTFRAHVTSPNGLEYIDVTERKTGEPHGLWRSFMPEQVLPKPKKK